MKKITLIGAVVIVIVAIVSFITALNFGEKSPIYAQGSVKLPQELAANAAGISVMYVVIFDPDSPRPMPYGAMKERLEQPISGTSSQYFDFMITKEKIQTMIENQPPPRRLRLKVRLDADGIAGPDQPGDLTGSLDAVDIGTANLEIVIDKVIGR